MSMENVIRVVAVDDNEVVLKSLKTYFRNTYGIEICATFKDGSKALEYLINYKDDYDFVILDVILAHSDGLKIMQELKNEGIKKNIMILSSFKDDFTIRKVQELGGKYYMLKPIDMALIEERIRDLYTHREESLVKESNSIELELSTLLHDLGIPSHIKGYGYIRDGIMLLYASDETMSLITKDVYPMIADKYKTTASRVERAIRHAIEVSWNRGDIRLMEEIFGNSVDFNRSKPTNAEFLSTIADRIRIDSRLLKV